MATTTKTPLIAAEPWGTLQHFVPCDILLGPSEDCIPEEAHTPSTPTISRTTCSARTGVAFWCVWRSTERARVSERARARAICALICALVCISALKGPFELLAKRVCDEKGTRFHMVA